MTESRESRSVDCLAFRGGAFVRTARSVPAEQAVAISVGGSTHAVMMATPSHLEDLGIGLALNERIVETVSEIEAIEIVETEAGLDCQIRLVPEKAATYVARRRQMTGPVGCGLCGVESLELAGPVLPRVNAVETIAPSRLVRAIEEMAGAQDLSRLTRAVHAAAFHLTDGGMVVLREDVGRHNALDKVAGHLARQGVDPAKGFITITSRVSVELIQKAAMMGTGLIAAISAPTELAIAEAVAANVTLIAVVRGEEFELFTVPERMEGAVDAAATLAMARA
ncbi:formate dehydrogenase accessory sulfurtransferase FdhD [Fulvimarina endophytica]|uniref:Sulfur carrier protein FdhD n=1 Tax=Fulvimarina endophytica TaxID=2293836 RepID=A0A371X3A7_9HYPH|nr:formate dehydrogenase accessory sulfurtransferase FdhD [Fulvimarina endophytica]RFC63693.1 formate dehydrogenase accessory sulfurtransferase FdhD [Fulvimarina endophytica]